MQTTTGKIFWAGLIMAVMILAVFTMEGYTAGAVKKKKKGTKTGELYILQGKKIINLTPGELIFRTALVQGEDLEIGRYGIVKEPPIKAEAQPLEIMVFDPETACAKVILTRLGYVKTDPASSFDLGLNKLNSDYFRKVYKMDYEAAIPIDLWCVAENIPLQITAVPQKPGWFRLAPRETLAPGNYAINHGGLEGPRYYTGEHRFYPFALVTPAPPPPPKPKAAPKKARKKTAKPKQEEVAVLPSPPVTVAPPEEVKPPEAAPPLSLSAGFHYWGVRAGAPRIRREYQITNLNDFPWHNVRIKIYVKYGKTILGPVTQEKDIVLPGHTVNQVPDKTMMHYETLDDDAGYKIYLEISAQEGNLFRSWQNMPAGEPGESNLAEIPWDLDQ